MSASEFMMRDRTFAEEIANVLCALASLGLVDLEYERARDAEDRERE